MVLLNDRRFPRVDNFILILSFFVKEVVSLVEDLLDLSLVVFENANKLGITMLAELKSDVSHVFRILAVHVFQQHSLFTKVQL